MTRKGKWDFGKQDYDDERTSICDVLHLSGEEASDYTEG